MQTAAENRLRFRAKPAWAPGLFEKVELQDFDLTETETPKTEDRLALAELSAKSEDPDFLRSIAESMLQPSSRQMLTSGSGAVLLEANDKQQLQHRYMQVEAMAELTAPAIDDLKPPDYTKYPSDYDGPVPYSKLHHVDGRYLSWRSSSEEPSDTDHIS